VLFGLIAIIALLLQTTVLPMAAGRYATPDLLLILCVYLGLHQHSVGGAIGAFVLGYLEDAFSGNAVGLNAFAMTLVFTVVYLTSRRLWVDNALSKVIVVFLSSLLKSLAVLSLVAFFTVANGPWRSVVGDVFLEALIVGVLSPPVFSLLARTRRFATAEEE
jgi:rod shape-determining protein MreD